MERRSECPEGSSDDANDAPEIDAVDDVNDKAENELSFVFS